jgi:hypothetical protein
MISGLGYGMYFIFGAILAAMGVWAFFFVPETKGVSLEEMDALFMLSTHRVVWAQLRGKKIWGGSGEAVDVRQKYMSEKEIEVSQLERPDAQSDRQEAKQ